MKKQLTFAVALCAVAAVFAAEPENLFKNGDFSQGTAGWKVYGAKLDKANKTLNLKYHQPLFSSEAIKVDPKATYKFSVKFASATPGPMYCGLVPIDKNGKEIACRNVQIAYRTDSELLETAAAGSDTIKVKTAPNWKMHSYPYVAFNTKPDYSDLPNYDVAPVKSVTPGADGIEVKLSRKLGKEYAAGTKVRMHTDGATYVYVLTFPKEGITEPTMLSNTIGAKGKLRFRNFTDKVKFYFYIANPKGAAAIEEIKFEMVEPAPAPAAPAAK